MQLSGGAKSDRSLRACNRYRSLTLTNGFRPARLTGVAPNSFLRKRCVRLAAHRVGGDMKHDTSLALYAYWQSCRRQTGVRAGGLRAAELTSILPSLFLVDLTASGGFRFRFCGAAIASRYGRDLNDEGFLPLWNNDDRATLERNLRFIASRPSGLVAGVMAETVAGGFTSFEMLLLPLAGEHGAAGAIGSMARIGGHDEMNRIRARIVAQWLRSIRFLSAADAGPAHAPLPPLRTFPAPPVGASRRYRHLTVVTGGK